MTELQKYPPLEDWHDVTSLDAKAWPDKVEKHHTLVPTSCFNCEAGCGLTAWFDKDTGEIERSKVTQSIQRAEAATAPRAQRR